MNLSLKDRLIKASVQLNDKHPFFAYMVLHLNEGGEIKFDEKIPTAQIDARGHLTVNPKWADQFDFRYLMGLLSHETLHLAFLHLQRLGRRISSIHNMACFPKGTIINGESYKSIENILIGDKVIDKNGKFTIVKAKSKRIYKKGMIKIFINNLLPIEVTEDHPFLIKRRMANYSQVKFRHGFEWKKAKDIIPKWDYIILPRNKKRRIRDKIDLIQYNNPTKNYTSRHLIKLKEFPINLETAWLLGLYVADGCSSGKNRGITFCLNLKEKDSLGRRLKDINKKYFGYSIQEEQRTGGYNISISSVILNRGLKDWCGKGAENKKIPDFILLSTDEIKKSFLDGYLAGDGCLDKKRGRWTCGTKSKILAIQLQHILIDMGILPTLSLSQRKERMLRNKLLPPQSIYVLDWRFKKCFTKRRLNKSGEINCDSNRWKITPNYIMTPITKIEKKQSNEYVYNLNTESHTYCVQNIAVHNCDIEINNMLVQNGFSLPQDGIIPQNDEVKLYDGKITISNISEKHSEELYDELYRKLEKNGMIQKVIIGGYGTGKGTGKGGPKSMDQHVYGDNLPEKVQKKNGQKWKDVVVEATNLAKQKGSLPIGMNRLLDKILNPQLAWRALLWRYIQQAIPHDFSWRRPSKKSFSTGIYLPNTLKENINITVAVDTSGSISQTELSAFLSEIVSIGRSFMNVEIKILICDAEISEVYTLKNEDIPKILSLKISGGGGTSHRPIVDFIRDKQPNCKALITFTDGYSNIQDCYKDLPKSCDKIIVLAGHSVPAKDLAPFGHVIKLKED